jgi:hypothetical protein
LDVGEECVVGVVNGIEIVRETLVFITYIFKGDCIVHKEQRVLGDDGC